MAAADRQSGARCQPQQALALGGDHQSAAMGGRGEVPALALYPTPSTAAATTRTDAAAIQATSGGRHRCARQEAATARGELTLTP